MEFLLFSLGAVLLVAAGALLSGGWTPVPRGTHTPPNTPREDDFGHDLAALLGYQGTPQREDDDET